MTKTTKQVVAEALGVHVDHPDMWDLEARDVVNALREAGMLRDCRPVIDREAVAREVYRELYPGTIGTHDSERTPESDLAEADRAYQTWDSGNEGFAPGIVCRRVADRVIAHLDADTGDDGTGWEYGLMDRDGCVSFRNLNNVMKLRERANGTGEVVVRRRRAGEWEEIPNE